MRFSGGAGSRTGWWVGVEGGGCVRGSVGGGKCEVGMARGGVSWICVSPEVRVGRASVEGGMGGAVKETGLEEQAASPAKNKRAIQRKTTTFISDLFLGGFIHTIVA